LLQVIPTLFGVTLILFVIFALAPSDYIDQNPAITPERAAELRAMYGLDKPVLERYWTWLINMLQGDWGESFV
jgi:peptide/nickel transport system permease protein